MARKVGARLRNEMASIALVLFVDTPEKFTKPRDQLSVL
jgi:hypothetical protein